MYIRADQVVKFVQNPVNDFDQQMSLLILQGGAHKQRQNLVEERPRAELTGLVGDLTERCLAHRGCTVLKCNVKCNIFLIEIRLFSSEMVARRTGRLLEFSTCENSKAEYKATHTSSHSEM